VNLLTYSLETKQEFDGDYAKRCRKNEGFRRTVDKKIQQIIENPLHYNPLQWPMGGLRRVHIMGSFVLTYKVEENLKKVVLFSLKPHDEAYGR